MGSASLIFATGVPLPDWNAGAVKTTILMPHRRGQLPAVRAVVDFLAKRLGDAVGAGRERPW